MIQEGIGEGGPIEGNDIAVYHVKPTNFKLGTAKTKAPNCDPDIEGTCDHIWPICLPKNDDDNTNSRGMVAGWVDAPPVTQINANFFGSAVSGEDVIRF